MKQRGPFSRLHDLIRGAGGARLAQAEAHNSDSVYAAALERQGRHYDRMQAASARLAYLAKRAEAERDALKDDRALLDSELARRGGVSEFDKNDALCVALLKKRRDVKDRIATLDERLERLIAQADGAKQELGKLRDSVRKLRDERAEMASRKATAEAREQTLAAVAGSAAGVVEEDVALENVRTGIAEMEHRVEIAESVCDDPIAPGVSLGGLRRQADEAAIMEELRAMREAAARA